MNRERSTVPWSVAVGLLAVLVLFAATQYHSTLSYLHGIWSNVEEGEYGHGYLVIGMCLFLIYRKLPTLRSSLPVLQPAGLIAMLLSGLVWLLGAMANVEMLQAFSALMMLVAISWTMLGTTIIKQLLVPLGILVFAIPVWFPLSPPLQDWTADFVFVVIRILGIPAYRDDNFIVLASGTISIEEACSGLRFLLAALTLGTFYGQVYFDTLRARVSIMVIAAVSAIAANFIRVLIIVILAHQTDMQHPMVHDHLTLGWYVFGVILVLLLILDNWLHRRRTASGSDGVEAPVMESPQSVATGRPAIGAWVGMSVLGCVLIFTAPAWFASIQQDMEARADDPPPALPNELPGWIVAEQRDTSYWSPVYVGADIRSELYRDDSDRHLVKLVQAHYSSQQQGEELISYLNRVFERNSWRSNYSFARPREAAGIDVLEQQIQHKLDGRRYLIWYWYDVAGTLTTDKYMAKWLQVTGMFRARADATARLIAVPIVAGEERARAGLAAFLPAYLDDGRD